MAKVRATKVSPSESYLEIDLEEIFGGPVPDNSGFRQMVGQEIIDIIEERTQGNEFLSAAKKSYSDDYTKSLEFRVFGKSKNDVNLTASGTMLRQLNIINEGETSIRIGWDDPNEAAKGTNHNFGVTVPKREFLGLKNDEIKDLKDMFKDDLITFSEEPDITSSSIDNLRAFIEGEASISSQTTEVGIMRQLFEDFDLFNFGGSDG